MALEQLDTKRPRTDNTDTMMTSIKDLLHRQHQQLEQAICTQFEATKHEIRRELGGVKEEVAGVTDKMGALEERAAKLEAPPTQHDRHQAGQPAPNAPFSPCQVVVGGWDDATKRADLLSDMETILSKAEVKDKIQEVVVTGKRRSFVLLRVTPDNEQRAGIWRIVRAIKGLDLTHPNGKKLWVAPSKTPMERRRATVANVTLKTILTLAPHMDKNNVDHLDVEYSSGTLWLLGQKVSSCQGLRPTGHETVEEGWIDIERIARLLRLDAASVRSTARTQLH